MNRLAFRCPTLSVFFFGLLLVSVVGAAAAGESPRRTPQAREALRTAAPPLTLACPSCALTFEKCFATCFADGAKGATAPCVAACRKAAVACKCDEATTLRSEDLVARGLVGMTKQDACHGWISCQPNYPSCAGWSGFSACGVWSCESGPYCVECTEESCPSEAPYFSAPVERFRVCFDQFGNSCTEWQVWNYPSCGCPEE